MTPCRWTHLLSVPAILLLCGMAVAASQEPIQQPQGPQSAPAQQVPSFLADKYEVSAYLDSVAQGVNAVAKIEFRAQEVSQNLRVELHENLEVREVKSANGKTLPFDERHKILSICW